MENSQEERLEIYKNGISRNDAVLKLVKLLKDNNNKPLVIKCENGEEARLSRSSIGKLVSSTATKKSIANGFTKEQHFVAAADIIHLFRISNKVLTHNDKNNDPNIVAIHRFTAPLFERNIAYITVKEATEHGKRIYSIELMEVGKLEENRKA